jgi:23S rRNA (adenine2503-C2)-methyltransferase
MHVNVIPFNPIGPGMSGKLYARPPADRIARFIDILRSREIVCHKRDTRGDDVSAACGQLRRQLTA